ncbi:ABC transporter ATP-binding protein [Ktedonospora formicarum]|uniref:Multidrug ABC transporter ATP-binding protein n=1 Tax=Ktedonospora formicarum TaxID=2778364 RepID=A0A8J3MVH5_9CHLR|nr:ABC transporter ATP-binding protein [Ktedonospora formicarum]GHO46520.1 multidrug ABC transporter ATP-binding protein [Ktedonospora formicarum]
MIKLLRFLKPYSMTLILVLVLAFAQTMANLYLPTLMADIVDKGIAKQDTNYIWSTGGWMLLIAVGGTICAVVGMFFSSRVATSFGRDLRASIFSRVEQFSLHEFDTLSTASLITRTTNDTTQVQQVMVISLSMLIIAPLMCIGGIIMALEQDLGLSWILVVIVPVLIITIALMMSRAIPLFRLIQVKLDKLNLILNEGLTGVRVVRAFDRIRHEEERFDEANLDLTEVGIKVNRLVAALMPVMMLVLNVSSIAIIWFGSIRIDNGDMQVGALMAFLQYAMQILFSLLMVAMLFIMLPRAAASAVRINEVLATEPEIVDAEQVVRADEKRGYVEFQDVTFSYPGAEEPAISNITFSAFPGEVTAIIGGTGSGKSTLVNLIPRFYDTDSGQILVDGVDVQAMSQEHLREKIGFVPQKAVLFSGSIIENLRYGKDDATDEEMRHAAEVAQAAEFITGMSDGYNSIIAQGGTNVSGGQKQRLSIARALVRKPEIYIFDDSFSALDFKTDARLRSALKEETQNSTVLIVAQRVSTVMDADRIIVLDEGHIAGIGTHKELLQTCDVYHEIVSSQLSVEEIA